MKLDTKVIDYLKSYFLPRKGNSSVGGNIVPSATETYNLGDASLRFDTIYARQVTADNFTGSTGSADTVDGFHAYATPNASALLALDASSIFPTSVYPSALLTDGTRTLTGNLAVSAGITIDGVDISGHALSGSLHHLNGMAYDDHTMYVHNTVARTISAVHSFSPSVTSAPFTLGANAVGQLVTGLNADKADGYDFDQDVRTTGTPQFSRMGVGIASDAAYGIYNYKATSSLANFIAEYITVFQNTTGSTGTGVSASVRTSNVGNPTSLTGGGFGVLGASTLGGSIINATGLAGSISTNSNHIGNITTAIANYMYVAHAGTGTISTAYGLKIDVTNTGSGAITLAYGMYIGSIAGTTGYSIVTNAGNIVFNEGGDTNTDFRVEGDTDTHLFFTDASADKVGIGYATPATKLQVLSTTEQLRLSYDGVTHASFTVGSGGLLTIAPTGQLRLNDRVGIGASPVSDTGLVVGAYTTAVYTTSGAMSLGGDIDFRQTSNIDVIGELTLSSSSSNKLSVGTYGIYALSTISTSTWASGSLGWGINTDGEADFRKVYADAFVVESFITEVELALAGSQIVLKSASSLKQPFILGSDTRIMVRPIAGIVGQVFDDGDYVRMRYINAFTILEVWGTVVYDSGSSTADTQAFLFTRVAGETTGTFPEGIPVLDYGVPGDGYVETSAIDSAAPWVQVGTWATNPYTPGNHTIHTRMGNLEGLSVGDTAEFGIIAQRGTTQYVALSNQRLEAHGMAFMLYSGATVTMKLDPATPSLAMGNPLPTSSAVNTGIWMGLELGVYKFRVGNPSGDQLLWNGTSLAITGDITADGGQIGLWGISTDGISSGSLALYNNAWTYGSSIIAGTDANVVGMKAPTGSSDVVLWAGAGITGRASAPFSVTAAGALVAESANITGHITATGGSFLGNIYVSSPGKVLADDVWLDANGISVPETSEDPLLTSAGYRIRRSTSSDTSGILYGIGDSLGDELILKSKDKVESGLSVSKVTLSATSSTYTTLLTLTARYDGVQSVYANSDVLVEQGIALGASADAMNPGQGSISAKGNFAADGYLIVGGRSLSGPGTGGIKYTGDLVKYNGTVSTTMYPFTFAFDDAIYNATPSTSTVAITCSGVPTGAVGVKISIRVVWNVAQDNADIVAVQDAANTSTYGRVRHAGNGIYADDVIDVPLNASKVFDLYFPNNAVRYPNTVVVDLIGFYM